MPPVSRMGLTLLGTLALTTVISLGLRGMAQRINGNLPITLPDKVEKWQKEPLEPPGAAAGRDHAPALYATYRLGAETPINVSVSRATTLNAYRAPYRYLMDADAKLLENQEAGMPRLSSITANPDKVQMPVYRLLMAEGHSEVVYIIHWAQAPGDDPTLDALDLPNLVLTSFFTHSPFYICDVWCPMSPGMNGNARIKTLLRFAETLEQQIKALPH